jgi:hypothetical protein
LLEVRDFDIFLDLEDNKLIYDADPRDIHGLNNVFVGHKIELEDLTGLDLFGVGAGDDGLVERRDSLEILVPDFLGVRCCKENI